ncbi:hypothetical protein PHET_07667 [Paragonimus heterotremus]|uniref:RING-type domain-containing protein n=1 Tax=Paragonimus heterotremus TaxID=100268 RepID=A0A8J4T4T8_9TREM|nr:hypothetical protein PHET_07667 [Paragonimus heterotremus]
MNELPDYCPSCSGCQSSVSHKVCKICEMRLCTNCSSVGYDWSSFFKHGSTDDFETEMKSNLLEHTTSELQFYVNAHNIEVKDSMNKDCLIRSITAHQCDQCEPKNVQLSVNDPAKSSVESDRWKPPASNLVSLIEIPDEKAVEQLSNIQLRLLLSHHAIEHAFFLERIEYVERVKQLWRESMWSKEDMTTSAVASSEECHVCRDSPINCVILPCGHMATCMNCVRRLPTCPICRKPVCQTVRIFRV